MLRAHHADEQFVLLVASWLLLAIGLAQLCRLDHLAVGLVALALVGVRLMLLRKLSRLHLGHLGCWRHFSKNIHQVQTTLGRFFVLLFRIGASIFASSAAALGFRGFLDGAGSLFCFKLLVVRLGGCARFLADVHHQLGWHLRGLQTRAQLKLGTSALIGVHSQRRDLSLALRWRLAENVLLLRLGVKCLSLLHGCKLLAAGLGDTSLWGCVRNHQ